MHVLMNWWKERKYNLRYWPSIKTAIDCATKILPQGCGKTLTELSTAHQRFVWTHKVVHTSPKSYLWKVKKRKNISHYFFGDERNSDSVSQAPPHQIGLVKLSPSCHDHKRYMHWQKHLNQHRPQVSSWSLHQLARSNKKSHLFHYELGVHTSVKSSTIFLWPHVLVLG